MCGIAGFFQTKYDFSNKVYLSTFKNKLINMKRTLKHRGPDEDHIFITNYLGFAHTRLSIRDVSKGSQPMKCKYNNREAIIVYNGELYNSNELKLRLSSFDIHWDTTSDTEIILYSYLVFGPQIFKDLNGIFAFAIYENNQLIIVRDHVGVKPIFYYYNNNEFVFASEIKGIFAYGIKPMINKDTWGEIIGLGPAHTLGSGVFKNVYEILPGHFLKLTISSNKSINIQDNEYWRLNSRFHKEDYPSTVCHCNYLINDSIKRQMVSDIPICTFLSGGLDSSLVSAIASDTLNPQKLNTYSFDFVDNDKNFKSSSFQSSQDKPFATIMSKHIGSNHTFLECDNESQIKYLYKAVDSMDMPCMADISSSMLYFCEQVSKECHVTLTGECADEIFGGYPWFHNKDMLCSNTFPWSYNMDSRTYLFKEDFIRSLNLTDYVNNAYESSVKQCPKCFSNNPTEQNRQKISWLNVRWFMMTLLNRMDRCSMFSGLEARVPFADYRILEYVFSIPWEFKCYKGQTKSLLVECGRNYLPKEVLFRKKSPYPKSYDLNYEKALGEIAIDEYNSNYKLREIIDLNKLKAFISSPHDYGKPWYGQLMAGPQMLAYIIQISYWLKKYSL